MDETLAYGQSQAETKKHSGFGIASFALSMVLVVAAFIIVGIAGYLEITTPGGIDEESPVAIVVGLLIIFIFMAMVVGTIFGVVGITQKNTKKVFAVLGLVFNGGLVLCLAGLIILGTMIDDPPPLEEGAKIDINAIMEEAMEEAAKQADEGVAVPAEKAP